MEEYIKTENEINNKNELLNSYLEMLKYTHENKNDEEFTRFLKLIEELKNFIVILNKRKKEIKNYYNITNNDLKKYYNGVISCKEYDNLKFLRKFEIKEYDKQKQLLKKEIEELNQIKQKKQLTNELEDYAEKQKFKINEYEKQIKFIKFELEELNKTKNMKRNELNEIDDILKKLKLKLGKINEKRIKKLNLKLFEEKPKFKIDISTNKNELIISY